MVDDFKIGTNAFRSDLNTKCLIQLHEPYYSRHGSRISRYKLRARRKIKGESPCINVKLVEKYGERHLFISGNLRHWHFGLNNLRDLSRSQYERAIEDLGWLICENRYEFWGYNITKIELGVTTQLPRHFKGFTDSLVGYSTHPKFRRDGQTVHFLPKCYGLIVYDKGKEVIAFRKNKDRKSQKAYRPIEKLDSRATFLRTEFKLKKLCKVPEFREKCNTPGKILRNWDELFNLHESKIQRIKYANELSPEIRQDLNDKRIRAIKEYFISVGMKTLGMDAVINIINNANRDVDKEDEKTKLIAMYNRWLVDDRRDLLDEFHERLSERIRKLST